MYLGESVKGQVRKIRKKLWTNAGQPGIYLLTIARNPSEQLDLIPAYVFSQEQFPKEDLHIIGIAGSKEEAVLVVQSLAEETLREQGNANMREYLANLEYRESRK